MRTRELPLVIVECCTRYVVSAMHAVPQCGECGVTPIYVCDTTWWLEVPLEPLR